MSQAQLELDPVDEDRAYIMFLVPKDREPRLRGFLQCLEARQAKLGITDVHISLASLEEVFLNIARKVNPLSCRAESLLNQVVGGAVAACPIGSDWWQCFDQEVLVVVLIVVA